MRNPQSPGRAAGAPNRRGWSGRPSGPAVAWLVLRPLFLIFSRALGARRPRYEAPAPSPPPSHLRVERRSGPRRPAAPPGTDYWSPWHRLLASRHKNKIKTGQASARNIRLYLGNIKRRSQSYVSHPHSIFCYPQSITKKFEVQWRPATRADPLPSHCPSPGAHLPQARPCPRWCCAPWPRPPWQRVLPPSRPPHWRSLVRGILPSQQTRHCSRPRPTLAPPRPRSSAFSTTRDRGPPWAPRASRPSLPSRRPGKCLAGAPHTAPRPRAYPISSPTPPQIGVPAPLPAALAAAGGGGLGVRPAAAVLPPPRRPRSGQGRRERARTADRTRRTRSVKPSPAPRNARGERPGRGAVPCPADVYHMTVRTGSRRLYSLCAHFSALF